MTDVTCPFDDYSALCDGCERLRDVCVRVYMLVVCESVCMIDVYDVSNGFVAQVF